MSIGGKSREHHWWPVGLQKYWADRNGDVWSVNPEGKIDHKRAAKRKIAYQSHGHTSFRGTVWESNFECDFASADNAVHEIIEHLRLLKPLGSNLFEFIQLTKLFFRRKRHLRDICKYYRLDERTHRNLLLLLFSLLIRSPASRSRYESYPVMVGLPLDEETGKANLNLDYRRAKRLCETGHISHQFLILIHSPWKKFIFGDGSLDWITSGLLANRIDGRALVPLTPRLCVYICTPRQMHSCRNCASLNAAPWMVDWINNLTQVYSREKIFFVGRPPALTAAFRQRQFLTHEAEADELFKLFDEIAGIDKRRNLWVGALD